MLKIKKYHFFTTTFRSWLILTFIALVATNMHLQFPCLMEIKRDLNSSNFVIQLSLIIGPGLSMISNILTPIWSKYYSTKTLLISCIILFLVGSLVCSISYNITLFIIGRMLQVLGDSGISVVGIAILTELLGDGKLGAYLGYNTILTIIFTIFASPVGAFILLSYGWRVNFLLLGILSLLILLLCCFSFETKNRAMLNEFSSIKSPLTDLFLQYCSFLKSPIFALTILAPAILSTVSSLFDFYSPVFYIDISKLSSVYFSYIKVGQIFISMLASFTYIYILKCRGLKYTFYIGMLGYLGFTIGIGGVFINNYNQLYLFSILATLQNISINFINPVSMLKAISCFPKEPAVVLSIIALARNIISTMLTMVAAYTFNNSICSTIIIIGVMSLPLCYFLLLIKNRL